MRILFVLSIVYLFGSSVFAGNEVGNGGDVVLCSPKGDTERPPQLLDFYEAGIESDYTLESYDQKDEYQLILKVLESLKKVSQSLSEKYQRDLKSFRLKTTYVTGSKLRNIKDSFHTSVKNDCRVEQIAIQKESLKSGDTKIFINKDLYEKMTSLHKAGLIMHEIVYEHFRFFKETTSIKVRAFNRYLFSKEIKNHSKKELLKLSEELDIPLY